MKVTKDNLEEVIKSRDIESVIETFKDFLSKNAWGIKHKVLASVSTVDVDDLYSAGVIGLINAVDKFEWRKSTPEYNFGNFVKLVQLKVRTAMLDERDTNLLCISAPKNITTYVGKVYSQIIQENPDLNRDELCVLIRARFKLKKKDAYDIIDLCNNKYHPLQQEESEEYDNEDEQIAIDPDTSIVYADMLEQISHPIQRNIVEDLAVHREKIGVVAERYGLEIKNLLRIYFNGIAILKGVLSDVPSKG